MMRDHELATMTRAPRPASAPTRRNPNGAPNVALQIVGRHGPLPVADLEARVKEHFKGYPMAFDVLLRSLTVTGVARVQCDLVCVTTLGLDRIEGINTTHGQLVEGASSSPTRRRQVPEGASPPEPLVLPDGVDPAQLIRSKRQLSSAADNRPQPGRPGADDGLGLPSRMGEQLHYRNGVVTDLAGNVLHAARKGEVVYRPTHSGQDRARPVYTS